MPDREKVLKGMECHVHPYDCYNCPYWDQAQPLRDCEVDQLMADAFAMLKEQDEERKRIISWMGKFCAHADNEFRPMPDEENTRFFRKKMQTQFGWEVTGDACIQTQ